VQLTPSLLHTLTPSHHHTHTPSLTIMVQIDINTTIEFDFEKYVQHELLPEIEKEGASLNTFGLASSFGKGSDPKRRTVVCRHWLVGLCQKGNDCAYLHKLDKSRAVRYGME
jgi:hypothetical protein